MFRRRQQRAARTHRAKSRAHHPLRRRKLAVELLEDRRLLAVMTVTNLNDNTLANLAGGGLSLREAVEAINRGMTVDNVAPTSGSFGTNDEIRFAPGLFASGPQSIMLRAGELQLKKSMAITGPGDGLLTIDASVMDTTPGTGDGNGSRIFNIDDNSNAHRFAVTLTGLKLTGGDMTGSGGAVRSMEDLVVANCLITGNVATEEGGGIYASGTTTIINSTISENFATFYGGGLSASSTTTITNSEISGNTADRRGGGIYAYGTTTITNSKIKNNSATFYGESRISAPGTATISNSVQFGYTAAGGGGAGYGGGGAGYGGGIHANGTTTITGSEISGNTAAIGGGGIYAYGTTTITNSEISGNTADRRGGGIYASGTTTITNSKIKNNMATYYGGGGISAPGTTTITSSVLFGYTAAGYGGGGGSGGGIYANGTTTITNSKISGNTADIAGGGIYVSGTTTVTNSTISGNDSNFVAGGIAAIGTTTITNSTISGNDANIFGGGIAANGTTTITNSTISGNSAVNVGGGILNAGGLMVIEFSTITDNTAPDGGGSGVASLGDADNTLTKVRSSIIAGNTNSDVDGDDNTFMSLGYNLIGDGNAADEDDEFVETGDQKDLAPMLFALADNGGPTATHLPMPGSPAIDMGDPNVFPGSDGVPEFDQRGNPYPRIQDGNPDVDTDPIMDVGATEAEDPTNGPRVTDLFVSEFEDYPLFDPKPSIDGPTPLVHSLTIRVQDLGALKMPTLVGDYNNDGTVNAADNVVWMMKKGTNEVLPNDPIGGTIDEDQFEQWRANFGSSAPSVPPFAVTFSSARFAAYRLVGDFTGDVAIVDVGVVPQPAEVGQPATADIILSFDKPLKDDRYTFTVPDTIKGPDLKKLDGDSNANQPTFPSGDGSPGGNFVARFTVDSRPEIGNWANYTINVDANGNKVWDPAPGQIGGDATNLDLQFSLPVLNSDGTTAPGGLVPLDQVFAGKFVQSGAEPPSRLFDQLAAYGHSAELGGYRWIIDTDGDGEVTLGTDIVTMQSALPASLNFNIATAYPLAGDFDPDKDGDEIGLYNSGKWAFDTNENYVIDDQDLFITGTLLGYRVVGDFDGDEQDDLAVFNNNTWYFDLAFDGLGTTNSKNNADKNGDRDATFVWGFPGSSEKPVVADMDQDGIDDIGLWNPSSSTAPPGTAEWQFLVSGGAEATPGSIATLTHGFTPGSDFQAFFGSTSSLPIVGNFAALVASGAGGGAASGESGAAAAFGAAIETQPADAETLVVAEVVPESLDAPAAGPVVEFPAPRVKEAGRGVLIETAVADAVLADLRLILLNRRAAAIESDASWSFENAIDDWRPAEEVAHDLALAVAWDELG